MLFHLIKYKIKTIFRQRAELFWVLAFPILLGTCFFAAFSNVTESTENFNTVPAAIVLDSTHDNTNISAIFDGMATAKEDDIPLISITYTDIDNANALLDNGDIKGIITFTKDTPSLIIKENGIDETILKEVLDRYVQAQDMILTISTTNGADIQSAIADITSSISNDASYINTLHLTDGNTDNLTDYYYSLIAMSCLFASLVGTTCAKQMKANLSPLGLRKNLVPVNRLTIIISDFLASYATIAIGNVLLIVYLQYILKLNLGGNFFLILLVVLMGSLIGLTSGIFIGSLPRLSANAKEAINVCGSLFLCFLSGLMVPGIKQSINNFAPFINKINPATVITDALYALNIYDTYDKYISSLLILFGFSVLYCILSYIMTRRETYASV